MKSRGIALSRGGILRRVPGLFLLALLAWQVLLSAAEPVVSKEYQVKAAFLYNFTKFVEWAPQRFGDASSPIVIGVLGRNPFGKELEAIVKGRTVDGREIVIKSLDAADQSKLAHVVFVSAGQERAFRAALEGVPDAGILTVGETEQAAAFGAMINFTMEGDKVRFEINTEASDRAGLKIRAQLQKLAKTVRKRK